MSDYTPTTDDMQTAAGLAGWSTDEWREWYYTMRTEVRAQALRDAADEMEALLGEHGPGNRNTGYGQAGLALLARIRARADRIERGE